MEPQEGGVADVPHIAYLGADTYATVVAAAAVHLGVIIGDD
jgi:hypothetical protein